MIRYALATTTFAEEEPRIFGETRIHATYDDFNQAYGIALTLTKKLRSLVDALRDALGADGICVEVIPVEISDDGTKSPYAVEVSIELTPFRFRTFWFGDDCHDNGCPRLIEPDMEL